MNILSEETDNRGRTLTMAVFVILVAFFFLAGNVVPVPSRERVDRSLDLIMLEGIAMAEAAEEEEEESAEQPVEEDRSEPETSLDDFDGLLSAFTESLAPDDLDQDVTLPDRGQTESVALLSDVGLDFGVEGGVDLLGDSRPGDLNADLFPQQRGGTWVLQPNIASGGVVRSDGQLSSGNGGPQADLTTRAERPERLVESLFGEQDGVSLSPKEIDRENAVVRWMQDRLNSLDRPIRAHFEQQPRDLTVNESVLIGGKIYHLQMMYSPITRTLHVAWIDGDDIYYFVDPALQYRINYFEEGVVERAPSTEVVLLETEELSAQSPQAVREFDIFLKWWRPQIEASENG
ncbi:MAG: hypothetical protein OXI05_10065 [Bacteroidota bacterium]|nr:hypothetical protein [Bacteroidota bacterium]MXX96570.1 DUF2125 domain-containing protein [Rhodothermaceae bacterium]MDE2646163.1 hypothetical protein [Bacteroidota bacterium]MXZ17508.1 DUF2125 domain-containing protein [Rhodothermaceae bacterium]MXZ57281.1 DUF2125 domain-containing protein [Rhodothermaceae bacterium]